MDDRHFEELKQEALSLDSENKRALADALEENLASEFDPELWKELQHRLDAYDRGEMGSIDLDEFRARARKYLSQ